MDKHELNRSPYSPISSYDSRPGWKDIILDAALLVLAATAFIAVFFIGSLVF